MDVAEKVGLKNTSQEKACLKCHTTGGGDYEVTAREGVGCEACHGPGEKYYTANNHVDYNSRENGYKKAIKFGMFPILGIESLKRREKLCLSCHNNNRPCFEYDPKNPYKYSIPIQTVDSLMKNDINFRHPLRR